MYKLFSILIAASFGLCIFSTGVIAQLSDHNWKFLKPGDYHSDEAPHNPGNNWLALIFINGDWYLKPVKVEVERIEDVVVDQNGEKTGIRIKSKYDKAIGYFRSAELKQLRPGLVKASNQNFLEKSFYLEEKTLPLKIKFNNTEYSLTFKDNRVFLTKGSISTEISFLGDHNPDTPDDLKGHHTRLLWAGDLDRDGFLDLIIENEAYNTSERCVFLSSIAKSNALLGHFSCHKSVGC
ncbi:MAG: hypothetical protein H7A32_00710 [Deltaproteobacteria bacterium]|nr:hypothetical protein [Deltaproteobacteria bacterium]